MPSTVLGLEIHEREKTVRILAFMEFIFKCVCGGGDK